MICDINVNTYIHTVVSKRPLPFIFIQWRAQNGLASGTKFEKCMSDKKLPPGTAAVSGMSKGGVRVLEHPP